MEYCSGVRSLHSGVLRLCVCGAACGVQERAHLSKAVTSSLPRSIGFGAYMGSGISSRSNVRYVDLSRLSTADQSIQYTSLFFLFAIAARGLNLICSQTILSSSGSAARLILACA